MNNDDPTEQRATACARRRALSETINARPFSREHLEEIYGPDDVFDTDELREKFEVQGFLAPFCIVKRKSDGKVGTLTFQHRPRLYWNFMRDR